MAIRIEDDLTDTEVLLGKVLRIVLPTEERVSLLVPSGQGEKVMARLRVMITRKRAALIRKRKKSKKFTLRNTIHKETHKGIRMDCVIIWREVKDADWLSEQLEDLMTHG